MSSAITSIIIIDDNAVIPAIIQLDYFIQVQEIEERQAEKISMLMERLQELRPDDMIFDYCTME